MQKHCCKDEAVTTFYTHELNYRYENRYIILGRYLVSKGWDEYLDLRKGSTELHGRVVNTLASYSRGPWFKFRTGGRVFWLRFSWFSSFLQGECLYNNLELDHVVKGGVALSFVAVHWNKRLFTHPWPAIMYIYFYTTHQKTCLLFNALQV
jgi:hypothetical protein